MLVSSKNRRVNSKNRLLLMERKKKKWNGALNKEKEYLYDEAMKTKKECNSKTTENKKLNVKLKYLERELKQRELLIQELMQRPLQYPAYSSPVTQSKQALEALQRSYESNLVINLKKMIHDQKAELVARDTVIETLKHDMKGTHLREVKTERNAFEAEAQRLKNMVDTFVEQIGGVDQVVNIRGFIDQQQEYIKELEGQKDTQLQIYDAKYDECLKLEKKLLETEIERENARKETANRQKQVDKKQTELDNQVIEYRLLQKKKREGEDDYDFKIKAIEKVLSKREAEIERLNQIINERDNEIEGNESEIRQLKKKIKDLNHEIENKLGVIAEREYTIQERDDKIEDLQKHIENKQNEYDDNIADMKEDRLNAENNFKGQIDSLEAQIVEMINEKNQLIEKHQDEIDDREKRHKELDNDIDELQEKLKESQLERERQVHNLENTKIKHQDAIDQYEKKISLLKQELSSKSKEVEHIRKTYQKETEEIKQGYEKAFDEYKEFQQQKAEFVQKARGRKADTATDFKEESHMNTVSHNERQNASARPPSSANPFGSKRGTESSGDSEFDRAEDEEDILETHMNPVERQQIQSMINKINQDQFGQNEMDSEFERESSNDGYSYPKVKPVRREDITPQAKKILDY